MTTGPRRSVEDTLHGSLGTRKRLPGTNGPKLAAWRHRMVRELMTPGSPYALAMSQTGDAPERDDFLCRWRGLIAEAVDRLRRAGEIEGTNGPVSRARSIDVDPQKTAVLILAALHGGSTLSHVAQDAWPLNAALTWRSRPFRRQRTPTAQTQGPNDRIGSMSP